MPLLWMVVAVLLWQAISAPNRVSVKDNEIWLETATSQRQLTHDGALKRLPTLSPSGDALIYVVDHPVPRNAPEETIVLLGTEGKDRQTIFPQGYVPGAFDRVEWIDEHRIGAMTCGRANCMYWVIDAGSGKTIEVMSGGFDFTWSHNRQFVARRFVADRGEGQERAPRREHDGVLLNRDDFFVYPAKDGGWQDADDHETHDLGNAPGFSWSPDDKWVAFTDVIGPQEDCYVVLVSPEGKVLRDTVPIGVEDNAALEWKDNTRIDLHAGKRLFHFEIRDQEFGEIAGDL